MKRSPFKFNAEEGPGLAEPNPRLLPLPVIGATGTGKSKFLESIMRERLTDGFYLIDPHGTMYEDIIRFRARQGGPDKEP